eukprot:128786_1
MHFDFNYGAKSMLEYRMCCDIEKRKQQLTKLNRLEAFKEFYSFYSTSTNRMEMLRRCLRRKNFNWWVPRKFITEQLENLKETESGQMRKEKQVKSRDQIKTSRTQNIETEETKYDDRLSTNADSSKFRSFRNKLRSNCKQKCKGKQYSKMKRIPTSEEINVQQYESKVELEHIVTVKQEYFVFNGSQFFSKNMLDNIAKEQYQVINVQSDDES